MGGSAAVGRKASRPGRWCAQIFGAPMYQPGRSSSWATGWRERDGGGRQSLSAPCPDTEGSEDSQGLNRRPMTWVEPFKPGLLTATVAGGTWRQSILLTFQKRSAISTSGHIPPLPPVCCSPLFVVVRNSQQNQRFAWERCTSAFANALSNQSANRGFCRGFGGRF